MRKLFTKAAIISGKRTPIGSIGGSFRQLPSPFLLSSLVLPTLNHTPRHLLSSSVFSSMLQLGLGISPGGQALRLSGIENIPVYLINNGHSGGLKSLILAAQAIELGDTIVLCGGFDSASLAPHSIKGRIGWSARENVLDELSNAYFASSGIHYGLAIEEINTKFNITREDQEKYARHAFKRRSVCIKTRYFDQEIHKSELLEADELCIYPEYKDYGPLFYSAGSVTSYTTSLPSDGAVMMQVGGLNTIEEYGLGYLASIEGFFHERCHPVLFPRMVKESVNRLLHSRGIHIDNIGVWEINDFFATLPAVVGKMLGLGYEKVNLTGGNLAVGDTMGASGARAALTCCNMMIERKSQYGVVFSSNCDGEIFGVLLKANPKLINS